MADDMTLNDLILVSVDDHVNEPPEMFDKHIPARFKEQAPRVVKTANGKAWEVEGQVRGGLGLNAVVGRPKSEYGFEPTSYDQMRKGTYDIHARIDDMNVNGVLGSMCFPQFPGFAGVRFLEMKDKDAALAVIRAYNDWHIHDWCAVYPGRFIPIALLPLWDISASVAEVERMVRLGCHAISFSDNPALLGLPSLHSDFWEPLWKVCADNNVVICCHIGTGAMAAHASDESPIGSWITSMPISISNSAADWLFASFWQRYPTLKMALSEGGIGWIPYFLERADFTVQQHGAWTNHDFGGLKPSELFKKHFITCFIEDEFGLHNLDFIGEDMVTWECDYPHSDCSWPVSPEMVWKGLQKLPRGTIDKVTHLNAMREFNYDPFSVLGREGCTVGALRAKATHVDTAEKGFLGGLNPRFDPDRPVTSADIKRILSTT